METIIVLAVTSGLFVSAMIMMSGQQAKTEFRQAVGETQSLLDDTANDVATGYYSVDSTMKCYKFLTDVGFTAGTGQEKGTSSVCTFLGRVVQFAATTPDKTSTYSVAGLRELKPGVLATTLTEAKARVSPEQTMITTSVLPGGLTVQNAFYQATVGGAKVPISGVAFVSTLGSSTGSSLKPGVSSVDIIPLPGALNVAQGAFGAAATTTLQDGLVVKNPQGGISVCLDSGGTNQHVILRIGVNGSMASELSIRNGKSASDSECV